MELEHKIKHKVPANLLQKLYEVISNAPTNINRRGSRIFNSDGCLLKSIEKGKYTILVESESRSKNYNIEVFLGAHDKFTIKCDCPYGGSPSYPCKHMVASALYINRNKEDLKVIDLSARSKSQERILDHRNFQNSDIASLVNKGVSHYIKSYYYNIPDFIKVERGQFVTKVEEDYRSYETKFDITEEEITINCNCKSVPASQSKICHHAGLVINYIKTSFGTRLFLDLYYWDETLLGLTRNYGVLSLQEARKCFTLKFDGRNGFYLDQKKDKIDVQLDKTIFNDFVRLSGIEEKMKMLNQIENKDLVEEMGIAFLGIPYEGETQVIPLIGKTTKDGKRFKSNLRKFDMEEDVGSTSSEDFDTVKLAFSIPKLHNAWVDILLKLTKPENEYSKSYELALIQLKKLWEKEKSRKCAAIEDDLYVNSYSSRSLSYIQLSQRSVTMKFHAYQKKDFYHLDTSFFIDDEEIEIQEIGWAGFPIYHYKNTAWMLPKSLSEASLLYFFIEKPKHKMKFNDWKNFKSKTLDKLKKNYEVAMSINSQSDVEIEIKPDEITCEVYLKELHNFLILEPFINYKDQQIGLLSNEEIITYDDDSKTINRIERNIDIEAGNIEFIRSLHPSFEKQLQNDYLYVSIKDALKENWFFELFEKLKTKDIEVYGYKDLESINYNPNKPVFEYKTSSGINWFEIDISIKYGGESVSLKEVRKAIKNKQKYVQLKDGTLGILPEEWLKKYTTLFEVEQKPEGDGSDLLKIAKQNFLLLDDIDELDLEIQKEIEEKKQKLKAFKEIKSTKLPRGLKAKLRPYQIEGYNWMNFLEEFSWGGCLADDMGLGKTLQVLTFLLKQKHRYKKSKQLVVVPTSLLFNWEDEILKFTPSIKHLVHWGNNRAQSAKAFSKYDVIITSYGTMLNDIEWLSEIEFRTLVLDESQAIKNPNSKRFRAACKLKGLVRLVLTGTPIENTIIDLYAQMHFLNQGYLGGYKDFKEKYAKVRQTELAETDKIMQAILRKKIHPFLLRRTKELVAKELPDKTISTIFCEMEPAQRKVYNQFKEYYKEKIATKIAEEGMNKAGMYIIEGLLKLRQICNSPALLNTEEFYGNYSVKLDRLMEMLQEKTGNHKVLIFSQFTKMLGLIRDKIKEQGIGFTYLDGKTRDRKAVVNEFKEDENCRVFLISLKAGGVGLNLVEADYVFIFDPWWNPAAESQAIDRSHRIGQKKKVFAYKMVCKDSIEEKILMLQENKKKLSDAIISTDSSVLKNISKEEINNLFS